MKPWGATGFTIVELLIVIVIISVLATLGVVGYNGIQKQGAEKAIQSDLTNAMSILEESALKSGAYPSTLPSDVTSSDGVVINLVQSGTRKFYSPLNDVQEGVLFAQICQELIDEGVGNGVNQGGTTMAYISGCGNWNVNAMQFTAWDTQVFYTPVHEATLQNYADTFTTSDTWNKAAHEATVKNFYHQQITRFKEQGGVFPIASFYDSWATDTNGGVKKQDLPAPVITPFYCIEATHQKYPDIVWHATPGKRLQQGSCQQ